MSGKEAVVTTDANGRQPQGPRTTTRDIRVSHPVSRLAGCFFQVSLWVVWSVSGWCLDARFVRTMYSDPLFQLCLLRVEGVPTLSRFSESSS